MATEFRIPIEEDNLSIYQKEDILDEMEEVINKRNYTLDDSEFEDNL